MTAVQAILRHEVQKMFPAVAALLG